MLSFQYCCLIEYSVNIAPHQSNYIDYEKSETKHVNISHVGDPASGNDATGDVINVHSAPEQDMWPLTQHRNSSHNTELKNTLEVLENNTDKSKLFNEVSKSYEDYDNNKINKNKSKVTKGKE